MTHRKLVVVLALGLSSAAVPHALAESDDAAPAASQRLATGQYVTPTALPGAVQQLLNPGLPKYPDFVAGEAVRSALSPDGATLAVLCAGQNSLDDAAGNLDVANSTQYLFLYDVGGAHASAPVLTQVIQQTNAHVGLAFAPDGTLYAAGGRDDVVYVYARSGSSWTSSGSIALGHGKNGGIGLSGVSPNASGLAVSADGSTLVVANNYNDSISVIDTASRKVRYEHDLRPFFAGNEGVAGGAGGTFPFAVALKGNSIAYVSSDRDREVVAVDISAPTAGKLVKRIKLDGNALGLALDARGERLYVAEDNADQVAVIDTARNAVIAQIDARGPAALFGGEDEGDDGHRRGPRYTGAATFAVTLSRDGRTLYAVNSGANSIAVIPLHGERALHVSGLIPTAYEPHDLTFSADGRQMYIVNGKNVTGPNPGHLAGSTGFIGCPPNTQCNPAPAAAARATNQYQFQLERASLVSAPVPGEEQLERLTRQVAANDFYGHQSGDDREKIEFLRSHIKHVVYVVKENRTFDQILGDLANGGDGDSTLTQFGQAITPNFHGLARQFVTLDNFNDPGDGSMDGWSWSLHGRVTNTETITQQINYAFVNRGLSYESEGTNRNVPVNLPTVAARDAVDGPPGNNYSTLTAGLPGGTANVLAGIGNHASSDAPFGAQQGYIFDAVLQAGGTVRDYGFLVNNVGPICTVASDKPPCAKSAPLSDPFSANVVQALPLDPMLANFTDTFFRGYDQAYPDLWRYNEWKREFDGYVAQGSLPSLSMVRFSHDHMGAFGSALAGVNTPETQQADDDLSVGLLVQSIAQSPFAGDTLVIVVEDDCQDGPDHVDSHRATAYVVGPYVKKGAIVSRHYSQVNALRTIEDLLGTEHLNLNTALQGPMLDVFDTDSGGSWSYQAVASTVLKSTGLTVPVQFAAGRDVKPKHGAKYWAKATAGFDFSEADRVPPEQFNRVLWKGLMGNKPYPVRGGRTVADR